MRHVFEASLTLVAACVSGAVSAQALSPDQQNNPWFTAGVDSVYETAGTHFGVRARNVILFVGDGMGVSTLTAARILEGQIDGMPGEENYLSFERFPSTALVKTCNVDAQTPDSAGTTESTATVSTVKADVAPLSGAGPDPSCNTTRALRGLSGTKRTEVEWDESLQIPVTYVQSQWLATGLQQARWKLVDWNDDAAQIALRFEQWDSYDSVDFADIGDNESDHFLARMINPGFIEHGDNNFYDSQGRVLSGQGHRH